MLVDEDTESRGARTTTAAPTTAAGSEVDGGGWCGRGMSDLRAAIKLPRGRLRSRSNAVCAASKKRREEKKKQYKNTKATKVGKKKIRGGKREKRG